MYRTYLDFDVDNIIFLGFILKLRLGSLFIDNEVETETCIETDTRKYLDDDTFDIL